MLRQPPRMRREKSREKGGENEGKRKKKIGF